MRHAIAHLQDALRSKGWKRIARIVIAILILTGTAVTLVLTQRAECLSLVELNDVFKDIIGE